MGRKEKGNGNGTGGSGYLHPRGSRVDEGLFEVFSLDTRTLRQVKYLTPSLHSPPTPTPPKWKKSRSFTKGFKIKK